MKSFRLFNVKSFTDTSDIELKPITIFVGRNSCGKSSLIRFPVVLSQTFNEDVYTPLLFFGNLIDYGSFEDVIHNHSGDNLGFKITCDLKELRLSMSARRYISNEIIMNIRKVCSEISLFVSLKKSDKKIIVDELQLFWDDKVMANIVITKGNRYNLVLNYVFDDCTLIKLEKPMKLSPTVIFDKFMPEINIYSEDSIYSLVKEVLNRQHNEKVADELIEKITRNMYSNRFSTNRRKDYFDNLYEDTCNRELNIILQTVVIISTLLQSINMELNRFSNKLTYIGPFRKNPERVYRDSENYYNSVGKAGENTTMLLRQAQQGSSDLLEHVSKWFKESMGYEISIEEISNSNLFRLMVNGNSNEKGDNIIDVGYGISQVLPIVTQLYYDDFMNEDKRGYYRIQKKDTFIIEQPELHLHPAAQANLADLFVEKASKGKNKIIIETHSEHLIRRLQVLVADSNVNISHNDIAIYYVDKKEDNSATISRMSINENGQFDCAWPTGFFDKSYELSKQLLMVSRKKGKI